MKQAWQKFSGNRMSYIFKENTLKLYDHFKSEFITVVTLNELNYFQDSELA